MDWQTQSDTHSPCTLILDASAETLHIVVAREGALLAAEEWRMANRATEVLAPALSALCSTLALSLADFGRIACVNGPGSFTGIRLVLTTAMAFARIHPLLLAPLNGMQVLARALCLRLTPPEGTRLVILTHARRGLLHAQSFLVSSNAPCALEEPGLYDPKTVLSHIQVGSFLGGNGLARYDLFSAQAFEKNLTLVPDLVVSTEALLQEANSASYGKKDLTPLYIRPCDAVTSLERLAERQGIAGSEAKARFAALLEQQPESSI